MSLEGASESTFNMIGEPHVDYPFGAVLGARVAGRLIDAQPELRQVQNPDGTWQTVVIPVNPAQIAAQEASALALCPAIAVILGGGAILFALVLSFFVGDDLAVAIAFWTAVPLAVIAFGFVLWAEIRRVQRS